jgi:surface antigen
MLALAAGGCSTSIPLASFLPSLEAAKPKPAEPDTGDITGSIPVQRTALDAAAMTNADWTIAKAALREALARKEDGASVPWENPITRSRGTVTPVSAAFVQDGFHCRNFLVSHLRDGRETWHEGLACRTHRGEWDIRTSRPLQKS